MFEAGTTHVQHRLMYTLDLPDDARLRRYGALDIETDGFDGAEDHLVAVGVGFVDNDGTREVEVHTLRETRGDEAALVDAAVEWLHRRRPE
ncbi:MAG: ribonuclease H-like domain-containing protein, partial [Halobacteriales archaeon]|nr:ribonuclease H-like domain-containing protein [Halobacteriales archaeon]